MLRPSIPPHEKEFYMKKRILAGLLAGLLVLSLSACTKSDPTPSGSPSAEPTPSAVPTPSAEPTPTPTPAQPPVWTEQTFARTFTAGDGTTVLSVEYILPMVQNTDDCPAGTAINDWYKKEGSALLTGAEDNYETAISDYEVSKAAGYTFTATAEKMNYEVTYADNMVYSIRRTWNVTGGMPYPSTFTVAEQFDAQTGIKLGFADLFSDADKVQDRVIAAFLKQDEIVAGQFTEAQLIAVYQPENFCLTEDGYTFWIQGNDLPALHSPVEVTLSYDSMKDVSLRG